MIQECQIAQNRSFFQKNKVFFLFLVWSDGVKSNLGLFFWIWDHKQSFYFLMAFSYVFLAVTSVTWAFKADNSTTANCSRVRAPVAAEVPAEEQGKVLLASVLGHFKSVYEKWCRKISAMMADIATGIIVMTSKIKNPIIQFVLLLILLIAILFFINSSKDKNYCPYKSLIWTLLSTLSKIFQLKFSKSR